MNAIRVEATTLSLIKNTVQATRKQAVGSARVATGLRVSNALDDASNFAIAQGMRGQIRGQTAVMQGISNTQGLLKTAMAGARAIGEILAEMRSKAIAASNPSITNAQKDSLTDQLRDLTLQIDQIATNAGFNGKNLLVETRSDLSDSTFDVSSQISTSQPSLGAASDVDGDGDIDLVFGNAQNEISLLTNDGSGGFTASNLQAATGTVYTRPVLEDFDGDGDSDLIIGIYTSAGTGTAAEYFENNGSGSFTSTGAISDAPARNGASGQFNEDLESGDIDNDGIPDVVSIDQYGNPVTLLSNGDGTFSGVTSTLSPALVDSDGSNVYTTGFTLGDVDGDGNTDIMVQDQDGEQMLLGLGDGTGAFDFGNGKSVILDSEPRTTHLADLNNDGNLDLLVAHTNKFVTFTGDGSGNFEEVEELATDDVERINGFSAVLDLNDDGIKDYISSSRDDATVSVYQGDGDGSFTLAESITVSKGYGVVAADFNDDGVADFAVGENNADRTVEIFLNADPDSVSTSETLSVLTSTDGKSLDVSFQGMQSHNFGLDWETIKENPSGQLTTIETAIARNQAQIAQLGADYRALQGRHDFLEKVMDATEAELGNLVDADMGQEAARMAAHQIQAQLATRTLSIANEHPKLLLNLFR